MNRKLSRIQRTSGQALIESVGALVIVTIVVVGMIFFLVSTAMTGYYKYCLGFIATQGATYAASRPPATVQDDTTTFVESMEQQMHVGTGKPTVTVSPTTVGTATADSVTVSDQFSVVGVGQGLWNMQLQATGIAAYLTNPTLQKDVTNVTNNAHVSGMQAPDGWLTLDQGVGGAANGGVLSIGNTDQSVFTYFEGALGPFHSQSNGGAPVIIPVYNPVNLPAAQQNLMLASPPSRSTANGPDALN